MFTFSVVSLRPTVASTPTYTLTTRLRAVQTPWDRDAHFFFFVICTYKNIFIKKRIFKYIEYKPLRKKTQCVIIWAIHLIATNGRNILRLLWDFKQCHLKSSLAIVLRFWWYFIVVRYFSTKRQSDTTLHRVFWSDCTPTKNKPQLLQPILILKRKATYLSKPKFSYI